MEAMDNTSDWPETCNRYIAYLDIMGFENYIYTNKHETVKKRLSDLQMILRENQSFLNEIYGWNGKIYKEQILLKSVMFSDSVILISRDASFDSLGILIAACEWLLFECFCVGIPIKGAISYGKLTADFDKNIFVGIPLIDAYKLENELYFYGIIFDKNAEKKLVTNTRMLKVCCRTKVSLKGGDIFHTTVNWVNRFVTQNCLLSPVQLAENFYTEVSGNARKYVDNTVNIVRILEKTHFPDDSKE